MGVIGTISGYPSNKFAFPRSYITRVGVRSGPAAAIWTDNQVDLVNLSTGALYWTTIFWDTFWTWSSNRYTLDYIVSDCFYFPTPLSPPTPLDVIVVYETDPTTFEGIITVSPFAGQPMLFTHPTPPSPTDFWWPANP